ncbi:MAG: hypothetical protein AB7U59_17250 [Desulfovibrionaceae bacterium]
MSELTTRRAAWQAKEDARLVFFDANATTAPNTKAIYDHLKEGAILTLAESIVAGTTYNASASSHAMIDANMQTEAETLAASAGE